MLKKLDYLSIYQFQFQLPVNLNIQNLIIALHLLFNRINLKYPITNFSFNNNLYLLWII